MLFIDRINHDNNLRYAQRISATNPCGEIPLQPYGACDLGSLNLVPFVRDPFTERARLDLAGLLDLVPVTVRLLDDVVDASAFPVPSQAEQARSTRRIGLGITGLADALILLGLPYGSQRARDWAAGVTRQIAHSAYRASVALAKEKGAFPALEAARHLQTPFVARLPDDVKARLRTHGIRNSHLLAIAPTGTISLLPEAFVTALDLSPREHLEMQAALQPFVDNAISKTINVPTSADFETFREVYDLAWARGLKGCTTYRPNPTTGAVLEPERPAAVGCCTLDREDAA